MCVYVLNLFSLLFYVLPLPPRFSAEWNFGNSGPIMERLVEYFWNSTVWNLEFDEAIPQ